MNVGKLSLFVVNARGIGHFVPIVEYLLLSERGSEAIPDNGIMLALSPPLEYSPRYF